MPLRVSCPGPVLRLFSSGGGWAGPFVPLPGVGSLAPLRVGPLSRAGCARCGGGTRAPRGGRLLPGCGASGVGRSPTPDRPSLGRAAGARYPLAVGAGGVGVGTRHQSHSARSCELPLRAVGAARGRPGGAPLAWVWCVRGWALTHARPPVLGACGRGPLPTGCGCGGCGRGDPSPTPQRALLQAGFARCGGGTRAPGGGRLLLGCGASGVGRSPTPDRPSLGRAASRGPLPTGCGCGGCGRGDPSLTPQRALLRAAFARCGGGTRAPGGGASCLGVVRPGLGALPRPTARPWGVRPGPATHWLWVRGVWAWGPVTNPTARALASWLCALWERHEGARGGASLAWVWCVRGWALTHARPPVLGACSRGPLPTGYGCGGCGRGDPSPTPRRALLRAGLRAVGAARGRPGGGGASLAWVWCVRGWALTHARPPVLGACGRGPLPTGCGCGGCGRGDPPPTPQRALLRAGLRAVGAARGRPGGGGSFAWVWCVRGWALTHARPPVLGACGRGPLPTGCGCGGCGRGDPSPTPQRALLQAGFARCGGGTRAPGGGRLLPGCGASGVGRSPTPDRPSLGRAAGARYPLAVGAVCGRGGPAVRGTFSRAAVRRVLCALPGFAAPGGRCCLAPVLVPRLWPAACLSGVPRGPALVRRASSGPVALGAPVGFPVAVVPSPTPGAVAPGFTGWLRGASGGRPRTGLIVPATGPCRGRGAGLAPRRTRSGPRDGVVPGGSLRLRSWAACVAVVWRVWTRSLTRPVSRTVRRSFDGGQ